MLRPMQPTDIIQAPISLFPDVLFRLLFQVLFSYNQNDMANQIYNSSYKAPHVIKCTTIGFGSWCLTPLSTIF
jgi:hypothetical protein